MGDGVMYHIKILFLFLLPSVIYANGGGPLLLIISGFIFTIGQVWILSTETYFLNKVTNTSISHSFKYVFLANLISTIVIGFGFPFLLALITGLGTMLPTPYGGYFSIVGTWAYSNAPHVEYVEPITFIWLFITFILTVYCEKLFYKKHYKKIGFDENFNLNTFIWKIHLISYSGLLIILLLMFSDIL